MKALVYEGIGKLAYSDLPEPQSGFLVRVSGAGICGTDLKTYLKGHHLFTPPAVLGHEFIGSVAKAPAFSGFEQGEAVVVAPYRECGSCLLCRSGEGSLCKGKSFVAGGAFAELVGIDHGYVARGVFRIPSLDPVYSLVEPLACVLNGVEHLRLREGSKVLIVGSGPMGALFALYFQSMKIPLAVVEPNPLRRGIVSSWGIEAVEPEGFKAGDFDNIVIAVNKKELVSSYIEAVRDGGTVLMFSGLGRQDRVEVDSYSIHYRQVALTGSFGYAMPQFLRALELVKADPEGFARVITHRLPLSEGKAAFDLLSRGEAFKIVLEPEGSGA
ncbi:MAG TPA: alcohol dehydrogenase catalytic domain-containing protein [Rectinemataceae bacterium]